MKNLQNLADTDGEKSKTLFTQPLNSKKYAEKELKCDWWKKKTLDLIEVLRSKTKRENWSNEVL